ncbi:hypothetical protein [Magnetovibrio sp.]|uniref:hypothetical protein n=1 Tax=Magnetovibrio sp. TaxID=2024836 RepID=UPI002F92AEA3
MKKLLLGITAVIALGAIALMAPVTPTYAATANVSVATPGVVLIPVHLDGQFTATTAAAARIKLPFKAKVLGVSASARASGGTTPTLTVDVQDDGTTILSAPVAVTAGAVAEATLASSQVADESVITIDLAIGGTSPTWDDIDVLLTVVRN